MEDGSTPAAGKQAHSVQPASGIQLEAWRGLLIRCGRKPGRKCVHALRVATLRLQAELEYGLSTQPADTPGLNATRRLRRQGKKLRRALGPVRQTDVYLNKLARVRGWAGAEANGHPAYPAECVSAVDRLARIFESRRDAAARRLTTEIKQRRKRLGRLSRKAKQEAFDACAPAAETNASGKVLEQIRTADEKFPRLSAENLHEFRKQIKKIRYLAEIFGRADEGAARQADALRRLTGAIGEWHDWQALAAEARQAAGERGAMKELADCLDAQAGRSFENALQLCQRSMRRLLREKTDGSDSLAQAPKEPASDTGQTPARRKPVASVTAEPQRHDTEKSSRAS